MKIVVTGSLGHISKPLTETLVRKGHEVTVISSKNERKPAIEALGARAAIGTMEDAGFLTQTFAGADIIYAMEALGAGSFFDHSIDFMTAIHKMGLNYREAILRSGVKKVIHLSSIGAHTDKGNGMLAFHHDVESTLSELPEDVTIKFMRPVGFYYNMFAFIPTIKAQGAIISNYGGDEKEPWVSTDDIASVVAEEMEKPFSGRTVCYIASDELSPNEVAKILGAAVGKPDLKWLTISNEQFQNGLITVGMNPKIAKGLTEMNAGRVSGVLYEDYLRHRPVLQKTKVTDFAKEFAKLYHQQ